MALAKYMGCWAPLTWVASKLLPLASNHVPNAAPLATPVMELVCPRSDWAGAVAKPCGSAVPPHSCTVNVGCVPVDDTHVRMLIIGARSFATLSWLNPVFNHSNAKIAEQDRAVVESSFPVQVPRPGDEVSVRTDKATLQFRKYYFAELHGSTSQPRVGRPAAEKSSSP